MSSINDLEVEFLRKATGNMDANSTVNDLRMEFYRGVIAGTITVGGVPETNVADKVYGTDATGAQTTYGIAEGATANTVAKRDIGGRLSVATAVDPAHAVTKAEHDALAARVTALEPVGP